MWNLMFQELANKFLKFCKIDSSLHPPHDYSGDGAIDGTYDLVTLSKGSAAAMTLAAPSLEQDGHELTIVTKTAFAHVVTATNLLADGVTGGAKDTYTFAAFAGGSVTLIALGGLWYVKSKNLGTTAAV
jgi:hypothetical protein